MDRNEGRQRVHQQSPIPVDTPLSIRVSSPRERKPNSVRYMKIEPELCGSLLTAPVSSGTIASMGKSRSTAIQVRILKVSPATGSFPSWRTREARFGSGRTEAGLGCLDPATGRFRNYRQDRNNPSSLGGAVVWSLLVDRRGILWIGMEGSGLDRYDAKRDAFVHYTAKPGDPESLQGYSVRALLEDSRGRFWVGTWDGGLSLFDRERGSMKPIRRSPGRSLGAGRFLRHLPLRGRIGTDMGRNGRGRTGPPDREGGFDPFRAPSR